MPRWYRLYQLNYYIYIFLGNGGFSKWISFWNIIHKEQYFKFSTLSQYKIHKVQKKTQSTFKKRKIKKHKFVKHHQIK